MKKFFPILLLLMAGSAVNAGGLSTRHQTSLQFINDGGHTEYTRMGASYSISGTNVTTSHTVGTGDPVAVIDLAMKMGMGHLPIKEDTPGERDITCADNSKLRELGWMPTINILDTV